MYNIKINNNGMQLIVIPEVVRRNMKLPLDKIRLEFINELKLNEESKGMSVNHDRGLYAGMRFDNTDRILDNIEKSCESFTDFIKNEKAYLWAALESCARADYWYKFEKEY